MKRDFHHVLNIKKHCGRSIGDYLTFCRIELCADFIVSAAARRSISVGGGGAPRSKKIGGGGAARRGRPKTFFSKIHEKISFYPQNFLRNFFSHQSFEVCR